MIQSGLLGASARYVTLIRDPADTYESHYQFYDREKQTKMNMTAYLKKLDGDVKLQRQQVGQLNAQLKMFGVSLRDMERREKVLSKLAEIDDHFDLVMLQDRFDESLVLLADAPCWDLEDVVTLKLNSRQNKIKVKHHQVAFWPFGEM